MKQNINFYLLKRKYRIKALIEYSNDMQDVYKNIEKYNIGKKCKIIVVFDDMIVDMINNKIKNKKLNLGLTELFSRVQN